jgi:hypothetical protein
LDLNKHPSDYELLAEIATLCSQWQKEAFARVASKVSVTEVLLVAS